MCNAAYKVNLLGAFAFFLVVNSVNAQSSRIECLEKIGNSATRAQLDACLKNGAPVPLSSDKLKNTASTLEEATCLEIGFKKMVTAVNLSEGTRFCVLYCFHP